LGAAGQARADGLSVLALQKLFAAGSQQTSATLSATQQAQLNGALQADGGDGSAVTVKAASSSDAMALSTVADAAMQAEAAASAAVPLDGSKAMTGTLVTPTVSLSNDLDMPANKSVRLTDSTTNGITYVYQDTDGHVSLLANNSSGSVIPAGLKLNDLYYRDANHGWSSNSGSTEADSFLYSQPYLYGSSNSADWAHLWASDSLTDTSGDGFAMLQTYDGVTIGAYGNRTSNKGRVIVSGTPAFIGALVAHNGEIQINAPMPGAASWGFPSSLDSEGGEAEAGWSFSKVSSGSGNGLFLNYAHEDDVYYDTNAAVGENIGHVVLDQSPGTNTVYGTGYPGRFVNIGYSVIGGGFDCGFCIGKETGDWTANAKSTLFGAKTRGYGGVSSQTPAARYGVDLRVPSFSQDAYASPGYGVDGSGNGYMKSVTTGGTVQAQTATVTGGTVDQPGMYLTVPQLTVQAPPLGGTTATMAVSAMNVQGVVGFTSTGSGYKQGDSVSITVGGGTAPTATVTSVDSSGGILALSITSTGQVTGMPSDGTPIYALTGGSGSGGTILVSWGRDSTNSYYTPTGLRFAATGSGYAVGDILTVPGDTGTAATFKVTKVSSSGGIMMDAALNNNQGVQVASAGQVTAIGASSHSLSGGSGSGASFQIGYGISAVSVTPGAGYLPHPLPIVTTDQSSYGNAVILPTMTAATAPLVLNPGGQIYLDAAGAMWVQEVDGKVVIGTGTTRLFSIDNAGNVIAKGTISGSGTP